MDNSLIQANALLEQHGFLDILESVFSLANAVFVGRRYVVRIALQEQANHVREAEIALHALQLGVRTAKPLAWAKNYSIFERLNGSSAEPDVPDAVWLEVLADLKRFHAKPFEIQPSRTMHWEGAVHLSESIFASQLNPNEFLLVQNMLQPHVATNLVFAHGDAWRSNVITLAGQYVGLIHWGNATWMPLEREMACLEEAALDLALEQFDLNMQHLWAYRLENLILAGMHGRGSIASVRRVLERFLSDNLNP